MSENRRIDILSADGQKQGEIWTEPNGVVCARAVGHESLETARRVVEIIGELHRERGAPFPLCLDVAEMTGSDPEQRKYMREQLLSEGSPIEKLAVLGGSFVTRGLYNMFAKVSHVPMKLFGSKEDAVAWLTGED